MLSAACGRGESQKDPSVLVVPDPDAGEDSVDSAMTRDAGMCEITPDYLRGPKACKVDADCAVVAYTSQCCKSTELLGVNLESVEQVRQCADRVCRCMNAVPARAEDGRVSDAEDHGDVAALCVAGECRSRVISRTCGTGKSCGPNEICVAYAGAVSPAPAPGENAAYTLECVPNPCSRKLDCSCAQSVCERDDALPRVCAAEYVVGYDVDCGLPHI